MYLKYSKIYSREWNFFKNNFFYFIIPLSILGMLFKVEYIYFLLNYKKIASNVEKRDINNKLKDLISDFLIQKSKEKYKNIIYHAVYSIEELGKTIHVFSFAIAKIKYQFIMEEKFLLKIKNNNQLNWFPIKVKKESDMLI